MSSSAETLTQKWLRQNTQLYPQKDLVYSHVDAALARFPSLRPKTDVYTYDDGRTQLLLCVHGLLPISYRGAAYNIPVAVWLTREYPRLPPIAYVVPTSDMLVRASKHVEVSGRCQVQYILDWQRKNEGCNLAAMLEAMQEHFSREPPVYAKPQRPSSPHPQAHPEPAAPDHAARPTPPPPRTHASPSPSPLTHPAAISRGANDDRPPLPAKPRASPAAAIPGRVSPAAPSPVGDRTRSPAGVLGSPSYAMRPPPPLPPPHPADTGLPQYRQSPMPPRYVMHEHTISAASGVAAGPPPINPASHPSATWPQNGTGIDPNASVASPSAYASPLTTGPQVMSPVASGPAPYSSPPAHPPRPPSLSPPRITQPQPQTHHASLPPSFLSQQGTGGPTYPAQPPPPPPAPALPLSPPTGAPNPQPSQPPPDIMDAEDDITGAPAQPAPAAPPRPPNPELVRLHGEVHARLASELASLAQAMALDAERLRAHQADLLAGAPAVRDETARLEAVRGVCAGVAARLARVVADAERNVAELRRKGDPAVDELVCSTTIVHNQLINLVAEDNAIEDTTYHLHRALNTGRIDLERFLRTARVLAEEQFMKRALIEKILAGLPMGESALSMRPEWS